MLFMKVLVLLLVILGFAVEMQPAFAAQNEMSMIANSSLTLAPLNQILDSTKYSVPLKKGLLLDQISIYQKSVNELLGKAVTPEQKNGLHSLSHELKQARKLAWAGEFEQIKKQAQNLEGSFNALH